MRDAIEFLIVTSVSCSSVTVTAPAPCGLTTPTVTIDLGASPPLDEQAGVGATPVYGTTVTVALS